MERYALSFTTGGLLSREASRVAQVYLEFGRWDGVSQAVRERNILQARTSSSNTRVVRETLQRLRTLSGHEIELMSDGSPTEGQHLMWAAACRKYSLIAEFAEEVVRERFLVMRPDLGGGDFDQFILGKSLWHPELDEIRPSTAKKLRQNVFRMLREAGLHSDSGDIIPAIMSARVIDALNERTPSDIRFFPTTTSAGAER
ncbi:DUF1819 family protein [Microbacterium sp.]|uniref:DUF1819 family protein n=1 Tax=Microbacterium sp. TaxID=51671 RepID=UPI003A941FD4